MVEKFDIPADAAARMKMLKEQTGKTPRVVSDVDADEPSPAVGERKRYSESDDSISSESQVSQ